MAKTKESETAPEPATPGAKKPYKGPQAVHVGGESILDRLLPHIKKIAIGAGIVAIVLGGIFGWRWWRDRARGKVTSHLTRALDVAARDVQKPDPNAKPDPDQKPTFATYQDRANAVIAELDKGAADVTSPVYKGSLLLDAGKLDEAAAAFRKASGKTDLEGVLAREGLGFVEEAKARAATDPTQHQQHLEAALAAFRAVQPADKGLHKDYALYHEGRILAIMQKNDEAIAAFEKALEAEPESDLESEINNRLATLGAQ